MSALTVACAECVRCIDTCDMTTRGPSDLVVECVNCDACRYCDCPKSYEPGSVGYEVARAAQREMALKAQREMALDSRARSYAAKWRADEHTEEPTDEALAKAFERCVLPAKPETYPQIRAHITNWSEES